MGDAVWTFFSLAACALAVTALQRLALNLAKSSAPQASPGKFSFCRAPLFPWGDTLAATVGLQAGSLFLLLTARPVASALLTITVFAFLVILNRAKERILREPLVLADAWLLTQIFRYPHLYFPFLPVKALCLALGVPLVLFLALLAGENPMEGARSGALALVLALVFFLPCFVFFLLWQGKFPALGAWLLARCPVSHNAAEDASRCGPLASALLHPVAAGQVKHSRPDFLHAHNTRPAQSVWPLNFTRFLDTPPKADFPHVVLVQAESLCDIRLLLPKAQASSLKNFLPHWDALQRKGQTLPTPEGAFGAYTMRTEFSMLTGLQAEALGPFIFNPHLLAARQSLWSLARHFQQQGYRTVCLHPYAKDFFRRDKVMPNLGFQKLLGLEDLGSLPRFGPYTSDVALGERILEELRASADPIFCFAITMEAHGPWLKGRLTEEEMEATLRGVDRSLFTPAMQMYLCHLRHMDEMIGLLDQGLDEVKDGERPGVLWAYGDHPPGCV